jgi:hypothetical protein
MLFLIHKFSVKWYSHCTKEKSCMSIRCCCRLDCHMKSRNHPGWVHLNSPSAVDLVHGNRITYIVVYLNFWEQDCTLSCESPSYISTAITGGSCPWSAFLFCYKCNGNLTLDTRPVLHPREDKMYTLVDELISLIPTHCAGKGNRHSQPKPKLRNTMP